MKLNKKIVSFVLAFSLIALSSCNFLENSAIENMPVDTTTIIEDTTIKETTTSETTKNTQNKSKSNVKTITSSTSATTEDTTTNDTEKTTTSPKTTITKNNTTSTIKTTTTPEKIAITEVMTTSRGHVITTTEETTTEETTTITTEETTTTAQEIDSSYLFENCAFIGDSLTVGLSAYGLIPEEYTFAKEGINLLGINTLQLYTNYGYLYPAQAISYWQPEEVYILLGINGVSWISNSKAIESYTQLINDIQNYNPNVHINVISVLPVAHSMETISTIEDGRILNSEIDDFNNELKSMANSLGANYIDVNMYMKNQYGCLPDEVTIDGLHLKEEGYQRVAEVLIQELKSRN